MKCKSCKTVFPCWLKNPNDASGLLKNGTILDTWLDELPLHISEKYNVSSKTLNILDISVLFGYAPPPKVNWEPSKLPLFKLNGINYEILAKEALKENEQKITKNYNDYRKLYLKGEHFAKKSFVIIDYDYQGKTYKAIFAKQIDSEREFNIENLYLVHHTQINLDYNVDGIFTRDQLLVFLERFLNRWRYSAKEVLLVVPFIGFNYKNSEEALYELWNWLEINIDVSKTNLITRKGTFKLFQKAQDNSGVPFSELVKLGLLEPLIEKMNHKDTTYFQKSHAKYYVGVYENYVEVLSGSFNIHQGAYYENINFKIYDKAFFKERYLHMFEDFQYVNTNINEQVHFMEVGNSKDVNFIMNLGELVKKYM